MLTEELLLVREFRSAVSLRVAKSIEEVSATAALATAVFCRFRGRRAVIDDPDLVEAKDAQRNLIELRVVGDRVRVIPVALSFVATCPRIMCWWRVDDIP